MSENLKSRLKKLEKKREPRALKLEDLLIDPDIKVPPNEEHRRKFAEIIGVDYEELYGEVRRP